MKYDFTTRVNRKGQGSFKWEDMYTKKPDVADGVVPLSVADMEFKNAPEIIEGLKEYLDKVVLGYTMANKEYKKAVCNWMKKRHDFDIQEVPIKKETSNSKKKNTIKYEKITLEDILNDDEF